MEELSEVLRPRLPSSCIMIRYRSHPMHGLYRFKSGFGGNMFHRMGCGDYPLNKTEYDMFLAQEVNGQKYHVR
ncbi:MAG: hypothetical protein WD577_11640 [Bacteroidales bacterium]